MNELLDVPAPPVLRLLGGKAPAGLSWGRSPRPPTRNQTHRNGPRPVVWRVWQFFLMVMGEGPMEV